MKDGELIATPYENLSRVIDVLKWTPGRPMRIAGMQERIVTAWPPRLRVDGEIYRVLGRAELAPGVSFVGYFKPRVRRQVGVVINRCDDLRRALVVVFFAASTKTLDACIAASLEFFVEAERCGQLGERLAS